MVHVNDYNSIAVLDGDQRFLWITDFPLTKGVQGMSGNRIA